MIPDYLVPSAFQRDFVSSLAFRLVFKNLFYFIERYSSILFIVIDNQCLTLTLYPVVAVKKMVLVIHAPVRML